MTNYDSTRSPVENIAEALFAIARALERLGLGQSSTGMGAIEALALQVKDLPERLGASVEDAIRGLREDGVLDLNTRTVAEELKNVAEAIRGEKDPFG